MITFTTMQLSVVIQLNQFSIAALFDASAIEHFRAEDGVFYYAYGRVCERD